MSTTGPKGSDLHPWWVMVVQRTEIIKVRAPDFDAALALVNQHHPCGDMGIADDAWALNLTVGPMPGQPGDDNGPDAVDETLGQGAE